MSKIPDWEELSDTEGELADYYRKLQRQNAQLLIDALTVETTLKKSIKTLSDRNTELERAIAIYLREDPAPREIEFDTDAEAVRWFIAVADTYEKTS